MISLITHFGAKGERRNGFHHLKVYASRKPKKQWGIPNALEEVILFENCSLDFSNFLKVRHNFFSSNHRHESNVLNSCFNFRDKPGYISDSWVRFGYRQVFFKEATSQVVEPTEKKLKPHHFGVENIHLRRAFAGCA